LSAEKHSSIYKHKTMDVRKLELAQLNGYFHIRVKPGPETEHRWDIQASHEEWGFESKLYANKNKSWIYLILLSV
jgi:hypothetical protein